ncbi:MAG: signal peptide peptidase SppA [Hyphomicrobiaceae bacterium]|jgi:signal peptide peptidase SppA
MWPFSSPPKIPVLRLSGPIGMASPLRPSMSLATLAGPIERAFNYSKLPAVAVVINSPGGSPTQSNLIFKRLRQLSEEKKKKVYVFCEDVAASGGYFLAVAGDEIYADDSSIVGSIGVIAASFGFVEALNKLGIERRVYTAGENKSILDPFKPAQEVDIERLKSIQLDIHEVFKGVVRSRRGDKLKGPESELFSGAFWVAGKAQELGLIDGITDVRTKMRELFGDKVVLHNIKLQSGGLLSRLRRPSLQAPLLADAPTDGLRLEFAEDLVSTVEKRMLWQRYGL